VCIDLRKIEESFSTRDAFSKDVRSMDIEEFQGIVKSGENQTVDFKHSGILADSHAVARLMVAFANTMGGRIIIGIKDDREPKV
jgi:hypothetical protein